MRLNYINDESECLSSEDRLVLQNIRNRRGAIGLLPLDLTLMIAPPFANGWNILLDAVRTKTSLADDVREIAICRTALINRAWFEWYQHAPLLQMVNGFSSEQFDIVKLLYPPARGHLNYQQWAVLRYADAMTRDIVTPQALFDELREWFDDRKMVELTATIATYNMVGRFLVALDVGERNEDGLE